MREAQMLVAAARGGGGGNSRADNKPRAQQQRNKPNQGLRFDEVPVKGNGKITKAEARKELVRFYSETNPSQLGKVDAILAEYAGKEDEIVNKLRGARKQMSPKKNRQQAGSKQAKIDAKFNKLQKEWSRKFPNATDTTKAAMRRIHTLEAEQAVAAESGGQSVPIGTAEV
jgi:hypothetical protein